MTTPPPIEPDSVLPFPEIHIVLDDDQPRVEIAGTPHRLEGHDLFQLRENARLRITKTAEALGRPVRATAHEPGASWSLIFHPDGTIQDGPPVPPPRRKQRFIRRPRR